jgi:hypothetical protein
MSGEMKANESPNHFMVLDAIGRGMKTADKISTVTKLNKTEVELILNDLAVQRLVNQKEKRGFLKSKLEFTINETGLDLLNSKKRELEQKTKDIKQAYNNGNTAQFQSFMGTDRAWIPFLLFSGLLDILFFASAMSFLGLAMSPQESSIAADAGGGASDSISDSGSDSDTTASQEDSGAADSSSSEGGGFEGGGFDSSGGPGMDFGGDFNF